MTTDESSVSVVDSPSQFVTVYGEVGAPGTFPLNTEMRIYGTWGFLTAIAFASLLTAGIIGERESAVRQLQSGAATEAGGLLRVLLLWRRAVPTDPAGH